MMKKYNKPKLINPNMTKDKTKTKHMIKDKHDVIREKYM